MGIDYLEIETVNSISLFINEMDQGYIELNNFESFWFRDNDFTFAENSVYYKRISSRKIYE